MRDVPLVAVDIGNQHSKFGWFGPSSVTDRAESSLPEPERRLTLPDQTDWEPLTSWITEPAGGLAWWIGSVNRPTGARLESWLAARRPGDPVYRLAAKDLPLRVALAEPARVGIDRLLDAVAVNVLRTPGHAAVAVDAGTAITVDLIGADGHFGGGAILPGMASAARALHELTDMLPLVETSDLRWPPPVLGTSTSSAIRSGVFWGAVGAVRQLLQRFAAEASSVPIDVWITGGAGQGIADALGLPSHFVPQLTLAGIAITAMASVDPAKKGKTA